MNFSFWTKWLLVVALGVTAFGILMALTSGTALFDIFNYQINPAFWSGGVADESARRFQQWLYGVWGATIAGWGIFLVFIVREAFAKKMRWAWNCIALGLTVWFVLDTALSFAYGVSFNVAFNVVVFIAGIVPLIFTRQEFSSTP